MDSILVAINDSISSRGMIKFLTAIPFAPKEVKVTLVHGLRKQSASEELMGEKFIKEQPAKLKAVLDQAKKSLVKRGFRAENIDVKLVTDPYPTISDGIIDQFKQGKYDMVVIGRKRMSKAEEFVLGDISTKLVRVLDGVAIMVVKL